MFTHEDLPLWSGSPTGNVPEATPDKPVAQQETWATCRFCLDTGLLGDHAFCWCEAGDKARERRRRSQVTDDARVLSSGTIANLTGLRHYDDIDQVQARFVQFTIEHPAGYETWQDAWAAFWQKEQVQ